MSAAQQLEPEDDDAITVELGRGLEGIYFWLYPLSSNYLRSVAPDIHLWPKVFIARETESDFKELERPMLAQVTQLLTGMSLKRLHELGIKVEFYDVRARQWVAKLDPAVDLAILPASG